MECEALHDALDIANKERDAVAASGFTAELHDLQIPPRGGHP